MGGGAGMNRLSGSVLTIGDVAEQTEWRRQENCGSVCRHLVLSSVCLATMQWRWRARYEAQCSSTTATRTVVLLLASQRTQHDGQHQVLKASAGWVAWAAGERQHQGTWWSRCDQNEVHARMFDLAVHHTSESWNRLFDVHFCAVV